MELVFILLGILTLGLVIWIQDKFIRSLSKQIDLNNKKVEFLELYLVKQANLFNISSTQMLKHWKAVKALAKRLGYERIETHETRTSAHWKKVK